METTNLYINLCFVLLLGLVATFILIMPESTATMTVPGCIECPDNPEQPRFRQVTASAHFKGSCDHNSFADYLEKAALETGGTLTYLSQPASQSGNGGARTIDDVQKAIKDNSGGQGDSSDPAVRLSPLSDGVIEQRLTVPSVYTTAYFRYATNNSGFTLDSDGKYAKDRLEQYIHDNPIGLANCADPRIMNALSLEPMMQTATKTILAERSSVYPVQLTDPAAGKGIKVAIIDTGINDHKSEYSHFINSNVVHGFDATKACNPESGECPCDIPSGDPANFHNPVGADFSEHGTAVALMIASTGGSVDADSEKFHEHPGRGVAPGVSLIDIKACACHESKQCSLSELDCNPEYVMRALDWVQCYNNKIKSRSRADADSKKIRVVNISLGSYCDDPAGMHPLATKVDEVGRDTVVVAAFGNARGAIGQNSVCAIPPGSAKSAITVTGSKDNGTVCRKDDELMSVINMCGSTRNNNPKPDIAAPAQNIYMGKEMGTMHGTSLAAPQVAGIAAMVLAANPGLDPHAVKKRIVMSADRNFPAWSANESCPGEESAGSSDWSSAFGFGLATVPGAISNNELSACDQ